MSSPAADPVSHTFEPSHPLIKLLKPLQLLADLSTCIHRYSLLFSKTSLPDSEIQIHVQVPKSSTPPLYSLSPSQQDSEASEVMLLDSYPATSQLLDQLKLFNGFRRIGVFEWDEGEGKAIAEENQGTTVQVEHQDVIHEIFRLRRDELSSSHPLTPTKPLSIVISTLSILTNKEHLSPPYLLYKWVKPSSPYTKTSTCWSASLSEIALDAEWRAGQGADLLVASVSKEVYRRVKEEGVGYMSLPDESRWDSTMRVEVSDEVDVA